MSLIEVNSGIMFDFLKPTPEMIDLNDIAFSLAKEQRFNNVLDEDWFVIQHVLLVHHLVKIGGGTKLEQFTALHHDDPEGYFRDLPTPLKQLCGDYKRLYNLTAGVIGAKYNINITDLKGIVKECDNNAMIIERTLFSKRQASWINWTVDDFIIMDEKEDFKISSFIEDIKHSSRYELIARYMRLHISLQSEIASK